MPVQVLNQTLRLGQNEILKAVSLTAKAGEVTVIVGPNGSGKTTLLKTLTGELRGLGKVELNSVSLGSYAAADLAKYRAVLAQSTQVAFDFDVAEIVAMGLRAGVHADKTDIVDQALDRVGMQSYHSHPYRVLSGGEQQRVQLARALAQVWSPVLDGLPCWLFLDEPVASLDIGHQLEVIEIAKDFAQRGGGVVAVMHDLNLTAMMADHVTVLQNGSVLASGACKDVLRERVLSQAYGCHLRTGVTPPGPEQIFVLPQTATRHNR